MQPNFVRGVFVNHALRVERFHQPDRSERQADAFLQDAAPQFVELQAAAAQIEDEARRIEIAQARGVPRRARGALLPRRK